MSIFFFQLKFIEVGYLILLRVGAICVLISFPKVHLQEHQNIDFKATLTLTND